MSNLQDSNSTSVDDNSLVELADGTTSGPSKPRAKVDSSNRLWVDTYESEPAAKIALDGNKVFSASVFNLNIAVANTQNPLILFRNPNASGKVVYIVNIVCGVGVNNTLVEYSLYSTPTVLTNGTTVTPVTRTIGSGVSSVILTTSLPTISSTGTLLGTVSNGQNSSPVSLVDEFRIKLLANTSMLLTASPASNNRPVDITIVWAEV